MQFNPTDRFMIKNTHTGNNVESQKTSEEAIRGCNILNRHNVVFNNSLPRCVVIDKTTGERFFNSLEYKI